MAQRTSSSAARRPDCSATEPASALRARPVRPTRPPRSGRAEPEGPPTHAGRCAAPAPGWRPRRANACRHHSSAAAQSPAVSHSAASRLSRATRLRAEDRGYLRSRADKTIARLRCRSADSADPQAPTWRTSVSKRPRARRHSARLWGPRAPHRLRRRRTVMEWLPPPDGIAMASNAERFHPHEGRVGAVDFQGPRSVESGGARPRHPPQDCELGKTRFAIEAGDRNPCTFGSMDCVLA